MITRHLPIITDSPNQVKMFPQDSIFCAYKRSPNLKNLMVRVYPYTIKPTKEVDQDPGCNGCMKRCGSCRNFGDHISSFEYFGTKKIFKSRRYLKCTTPNMMYIAYYRKCGKQGVGSTANWKH